MPDRRRGPLALFEAATLVSGTGNGVATVALPWLVLERTGSATAAGIGGGRHGAAAADCQPALGDRRRPGGAAAHGGDLRCPVLPRGGRHPAGGRDGGLSVGVLVGLAALGSVFDPAGITARETLLPAAASAAGWRLERANSVHEAVWGVAFLVGPGVGGLLIATVGAASTLWVTAVGFAVSLVLIAAGAPARRVGPGRARAARGLLARDRRGAGVRVARSGAARDLPADDGRGRAVSAGRGDRAAGLLHRPGGPRPAGHGNHGDERGRHCRGAGLRPVGAPLRRRTAFVPALVGVGVPLLGMAALPPFPSWSSWRC